MKRIKKNLKRYISFLAVLIILISITASPAHAVLSPSSKQRFGAMIASALLAGQMMIQSVLAPAQQMYDYIPDALGLPTATWDDDYLDRSTVKIWPDYVTIDGVDYTDIWFSNEAAEKFRVDAYDFKTAYSLASNSNGTFASGVGYVDGVPIFDTGETTYCYSQYYQVPAVDGNYSFGNGTLRVTNYGGTSKYLACIPSSGSGATRAYANGNFPVGNRYQVNRGFTAVNWQTKLKNGSLNSDYLSNIPKVSEPFDYDWVSGTIPADAVLPSDTGMMIRVPSDTPGLQTFITNNIDFTIDDGVELDFNLDPTLKITADDLIDILVPVIADLDFGDIQFIENHTTPAPSQDTLLPDTWWSKVEYKFDQVINAIQNFDISPVIQAIQSIPSAIQTLGQNIIQAISNLGDTILQDIEQGPIKVIDKALDKLKSIFLPILANLRNAIGIWHYVVEWINGISAPFTWIFGIVQGGMSFIMVPIYATIAGWIVIMVYKRFGR